MIRRYALDGIDNFRDFGGYAVDGGRRIARGLLFRSASHGAATEADLDTISALNIRAVIDLRRKAERERDPSRRHPAFAERVVTNDLGDDQEDEWLAHLRDSDLTEASFRSYLLGYYDKAPGDPRHVDLFSRYFQALATSHGAVLIHCAAGKDRTGILAALTHRALGVHRDDVIAEYLLTNDEARFQRRAPRVAELIRNVSGKTPTMAALKVAMGVEASFLNQAFVALDRDFGSVDAYLETALGVDRRTREALEARLLEQS